MRMLQDFTPAGAFNVDMPSMDLAADQFHFVESVLETIPADDNSAAQRLRATLDHLANAAGLPASRNFDQAGNYTLKI